ncbi:hypothetical protein LJC37_02965, partial [Bacteroidales bacterium OttesenSCG-928-E04]|nr:hypothetical protein [Bacteroidales bacterium OttesenSCG-928-E04]
IYSTLSNLNIKGMVVVKNELSKRNRTIKDTKEDTNVLIEYFKEREIDQAIVNFDRVKKAILKLFTNKRVLSTMVNNHLNRIQNSDQW